MRKHVAGLAIAALTATSAALVMVHPASATGGCAATMPLGGHYVSMVTGELTVASLGQSLPEWTLEFRLRYPSEQIKNIDGVRWEQHGDQVTVRSLPGAGLPADRPASFRYVMTDGVKHGDQRFFTLNGVPCGSVLPPAPSPSSSIPPGSASPGPSFSPSPPPDPNRPVVRITRPEEGDHFFAPATITVEATATPAPGRRITRVEFFHTDDSPDSAPFAIDTTAPYTAEWHDVPAGGYAFMAVAYDDQGASRSGENAPFVRVLTPGEERQAPYPTVVRDRLWGISPVIDSVTPLELTPLARSGAEARCVQGRGIWDGPVDAGAVSRLVARGVRAVYLALNEACWLGLPYVDARYGGEPYQQEVLAYTQRLAAAGITPIVGLTWSEGRYTGPGATCRDERAVCAKPMPDAAHALDFWQSVAQLLGTGAVVYDLFTAPYPDRAIGDPAGAWTCWRDGAEDCSALGYPAVGMWSMYLAVRSGSFGVLLAGGLRGGNDLSRWAAYVPEDWYYNIAAGWRPAASGDCRPPVLAQAPVVVTATCR